MPRTPARLAVIVFAVLVAAAPIGNADAQLGEINLLTDLGTPFPPGCLSISLPQQPRSQHSLLFDQVINVPSATSGSRDASIRVRIWRVACADEGFSVVLVRLRQTGGSNQVVVPQVFADAGNVDIPFHEAQLLKVPAAGNVGASGGIVTTSGDTWMLAVDPVSIDGQTQFLPEDYNDEFTLELTWESYSIATPANFRFVLDRFEQAIDLPRFDEPVLNGRFTGQWIRSGAPRQGLVLQIAEQVDTNFVFAVFFTYLDGEPIWVTGNTGAAPAEPGPVTFDMVTLEQGAFITDTNQPEPDDVLLNDAGSIEVEVLDCNRLRVNYDFTPLGKGTGSIELERLIRIAGYDCNPWQ